MSYSSIGAYAQVSGATTAVAGQIIQSAVWNNIHYDLGNALTQVMQQLLATPTQKNIAWMNGGFEVWQKGTGFTASITVSTTTTAYTADRWYLSTGTGGSNIHTVTAQAGLASQSRLCARVRRTAAQTGTSLMTFGYPLDSDEIFRMRGKLVSFSALVQAGANWSPASGTLNVALYVGTGSPGKRGAGFTGETTVFTLASNLTAGGAVTALAATASVVVPTNATQAEVQFTWTPVGTAGAADDFSVDDLQIEVQNSLTTWLASNYDRIDFPSMLQGCKRFYQKTFDYSIAPAQGATVQNSLAYVTSPNQLVCIYWQYPVELRATASITTYNPSGATANWQDLTAGASVTASVDTANSGGSKGILIYGTTATGTAGISHLIYIQADASAGL